MAVDITDKLIRFEDLRKLKNEKQERIYSEKLLDELENGNFEFLNIINLTDRNNMEFMQPLVYAGRNSTFHTYEIFKYYGKELQKQDTVMQIEIAREEPEIFKETEINGNDVIMLNLVHINPKVVKYISDDLKSDGEFIEDICKTENSEAIEYVIEGSNIEELIKDNPNLINNEKFIKEAIEQDSKMLIYANEDLRNNYEFMKEVAKDNYGVVKHVADNKEQFGLEAINATRDITKEVTTDDCMKIIDDMSEKSEDKRYQKVKEKIQQIGIEDARTMRYITAMAAQSDNVDPKLFNQAVDYSILTMSKLQKDLTEDGKEKVTIENLQQLITPTILSRLKEKAMQQGLEVTPEIDKKLEEYTDFYNIYNEKISLMKKELRKEKIKNNQENTQKSNSDKINDEKEIEYNQGDIEKAVEEKASLDKMNNETECIRTTEIEQQRGTKENEKQRGEEGIDDDKSNDERS